MVFCLYQKVAFIFQGRCSSIKYPVQSYQCMLKISPCLKKKKNSCRLFCHFPVYQVWKTKFYKQINCSNIWMTGRSLRGKEIIHFFWFLLFFFLCQQTRTFQGALKFSSKRNLKYKNNKTIFEKITHAFFIDHDDSWTS